MYSISCAVPGFKCQNKKKGQKHYESFEESTLAEANQGRAGEVVKVIKLGARRGSRTGSLTVVFDRWPDSQQARPSVYSTPRRPAFGISSNVPQSLMVVISNNYTIRKQKKKKKQVRRIWILFALGDWVEKRSSLSTTVVLCTIFLILK